MIYYLTDLTKKYAGMDAKQIVELDPGCAGLRSRYVPTRPALRTIYARRPFAIPPR